MQSDPIGLAGGFNSYGYVGASPMSAIDEMGLFEIIYKPGSGPGSFTDSRAFNERFRAYRDALQSYADDFQRRISKDCVKDRKRLQALFDNWKVWVDPNIFNPRTRATATEAVTSYSNQTTQFNFGFFIQGGGRNPGAALTFAHEFRHLMDENNRLNDSSVIVLGSRHPMEQDADRWARSCLCAEN